MQLLIIYFLLVIEFVYGYFYNDIIMYLTMIAAGLTLYQNLHHYIIQMENYRLYYHRGKGWNFDFI